MSYTFTKLFSSITDSSIWCEDSDTKVVWITMLAMADEFGRVMASVPGLAKRANVSLEKTEESLQKFLNPDQWSRNKTHDGRRIAIIDGGWLLLNHQLYRELRNSDDRKEQNRIAQQRRRQKLSQQNVSNCQQCHADVSNCQQSQPRSAHADADADADNINNPISPSLGWMDGFNDKVKETILKINELFGRREKTEWSRKEIRKLEEVMSRGDFDEEIKSILEFYHSDFAYLRRDIQTLLNNWSGELDRANQKDSKKPENGNGHKPGEVRTVWEADSVIKSCSEQIVEIQKRENYYQWNGGIRGEVNPEKLIEVKKLRSKIEEMKKFKTNLSTTK